MHWCDYTDTAYYYCYCVPYVIPQYRQTFRRIQLEIVTGSQLLFWKSRCVLGCDVISNFVSAEGQQQLQCARKDVSQRLLDLSPVERVSAQFVHDYAGKNIINLFRIYWTQYQVFEKPMNNRILQRCFAPSTIRFLLLLINIFLSSNFLRIRA